MPNVRVNLPSPPTHGQSLLFKAPVNSSDISGLILYYPNGNTVFDFADAHGNIVGNLNLFAENAMVQVILDTELLRAYVQNADTNGYIESELGKRLLAIESVDYPGCYYRPVEDSDEIEWINPPLSNPPLRTGEYRTIERFNGKPVYLYRYSQKLLNSSTPSFRVSLPSTAENISFDAWYKSGKYYISYLESGSPVSVSTGSNFISLIWDFENVKFAGGGDVMVILKYTKTS